MSEKKPPPKKIAEAKNEGEAESSEQQGEQAEGQEPVAAGDSAAVAPVVTPPPKKGLIQSLIAFEKKVSWALGQSLMVMRHTRARDPATRKMAWLFILSLIGVFVTGIFGTSAYIRNKNLRNRERIEQELIEAKIRGELDHKAPLGKAKPDFQTLGLLEFELKKTGQHAGKKIKGVYGLAEIEFVAECDNAATCTFIKSHLVQIQNLIISSFEPMDRDELLSREGKRKVRRIVSDKLNEKLGLWLEHGKVEAVHINHLLVN